MRRGRPGFGFEYRLRARDGLLSVEDYRRQARRRLPDMVWRYVDEGADDLATLRDNMAAFEDWCFRPKILTGCPEPDLSTSVAGFDLALPVLLAPTGFSGLANWRGDLAAAKAAEEAGTRYVVSTLSSWSIEEVAAASVADHWFQLYPEDGAVAQSLMGRARAAGMSVLFVTVDVPVKGNREGERRSGMGIPPVLTPRRAADFVCHPGWTYNVLRHRRIGGRNLAPALGLPGALLAVELHERELTRRSLSWDDVQWLRERWTGPLFLKGVLTGEDAVRAVEVGVDGVVVSNHGGRQLDGAPASLRMLPEVVQAVGGRAEVLLDGGVRRGSDVVKALALGAKAVLVGRPYLFGLAVGGEQGVRRVLSILREEIALTMRLLGAASVRELGPAWLEPRVASAARSGPGFGTGLRAGTGPGGDYGVRERASA